MEPSVLGDVGALMQTIRPFALEEADQLGDGPRGMSCKMVRNSRHQVVLGVDSKRGRHRTDLRGKCSRDFHANDIDARSGCQKA